MEHRVSFRIGDEEIVLETGKMAKQANGSVFARLGGSAVIATACCADNEKEDLDFIPLSVDYIEKYYAAGKIPGGFIKREGRPKDKEILVSSLIDRPIRPLFSRLFRREIQVIPMAISTDQINPPDILAMNAASAAITISDIPFEGPIGAVRMGYVDGKLVVNPTFDQIQASGIDLVVAGTDKGITMVEGGCRQVSEALIIEAIETAHRTIRELCRIQMELARAAGKTKLPLVERPSTFTLGAEVKAWAMPKLEPACFVKGKEARVKAMKEVRAQALDHFKDRLAETDVKPVKVLFEDMEQEIMRASIAGKGVRTDGRTPTQIRPITCEIDVLPRTHGSALFTRGETQALVVTTLGTALDEQIMDNIDGDSRKGFMLHYNFPPFSVGEVGRLGSPGRREIGHGHLAERAISMVLPPKESFPYTIRIVSEILESNGSSSMATVCGSTLSLLNAGVRMQKPVAGIAMGLVKEGEKFVVLSDILGEEDHLGDMDFKVAGTEDGITALQMDIKIEGVSAEILQKAGAGAGGEAAHPGDHEPDHLPAPQRHLRLRPQGHLPEGPHREDRADHRPGREEHQGDERENGLADQHRRRRHGHDLQPPEGGRREGPADGGRPHRGGGGRQDLHGPREAHHGLRRLRGDPPGQGRPGAHLQAGRHPGGEHQRRREGGAGPHRHGDRDRPHGPDQPCHQGGAGGQPGAHDRARRAPPAPPRRGSRPWRAPGVFGGPPTRRLLRPAAAARPRLPARGTRPSATER